MQVANVLDRMNYDLDLPSRPLHVDCRDLFRADSQAPKQAPKRLCRTDSKPGRAVYAILSRRAD